MRPGQFQKGQSGNPNGRPKGSLEKRSREIAERAAKEGISPLEVMVQIMREQWALYQVEREKPAEERDVGVMTQLAGAAVAAAEKAAPYMHPRLAAVEQFVDAKVHTFAVGGDTLPDDEWERTYGPLAAATRPAEGPH